ncbi:A24 family peptidase, partial [Geminocystis sp. GBBB08]|uniref:prepilin peptidase n=1 Tax=Geminocystis sp. GBBB08 TaxID=2604140 RepID=UPI0027E222EB
QTWIGFTVSGINSASLYLFISILSAVLGIWLFDGIRLVGSIVFRKEAMGGGDPKLVAMIGSWLGWQGVLITGFVACFFGTIVGVSAIAFKILEKDKPIVFGPFLVIGAITTIFFGDLLLSSYLEYIGF